VGQVVVSWLLFAGEVVVSYDLEEASSYAQVEGHPYDVVVVDLYKDLYTLDVHDA